MNESTEQSRNTNDGSAKFSGMKTFLICLGIILIGSGITAFIFYSEPGTQRGERPEQRAMLVDVTSADSGTFRPRIEAMGTVIPSQDVTLRPRVGGEILRRYDRFTSGGFVDRGDSLVKIDPSDYRNTLQERKSALRQAQSQLEIELGQQEVAREEFELLGEEIPEEDRSLVLRKPQLNSARAQVESARAALNQAKLDLERTSVEAPFDAHILSRSVSVGSQVSAGEALGRMVGLDKFWVDATISVDKLPYLSIPDTPGGDGADVRVRNTTAWPDGEYRQGELSQLIGELDDEARMARVRVAVRDPMVQDVNNMDSPPLVIGSYVRSIMRGKPIRNVVRLDREYVRDDDTVWLMSDGQLNVRSVDVVFQDRDHAFIRRGIQDGEKIVTSSLSTVVEGTKLRLNGAGNGSDQDSMSDTRTASSSDAPEDTI